ncbi:MAG: lysine--tRNA ligase [Rhodospirillales bacterium]|nr:lysine--tRNA ligase [Rhodospirillales bacterium]
MTDSPTPLSSAPPTRADAMKGRAWPFEEARRLVARTGEKTPAKGYVLFETGYGPSGLPHIGTFGEVARTTMVRKAFQMLSDVPTRLFAFSDDMDGLRKVPENVPNGEMLAKHIGKPLTSVPDPFGKFDSFGAHNNAMLREFLDRFGFEYEFKSSTALYKAGTFDATLLKVLRAYRAIMDIMLPTLGEERRQTYSPFMPVCAKTGRVLQVPTVETKPDAGTIVYRDEDGSLVETPVTGGACKLQWKIDWAMRWAALEVDYEMSGKDLIDSVKQSSKVVRAIGSRPPEGFTYELFLDENGEKISKSRGNGLTIEEWLKYGTPESLSLFMYQQPKAAKRLHFDVIPRHVDDYLSFVERYPAQNVQQKLDNPAFHIHGRNGPPAPEANGVPFSMLLNLVGVANSLEKDVLWGFISRYAPKASPATNPMLDRLVGHAIAYFRDYVEPTRRFRAPGDMEKAALADLDACLAKLPADASAEDIQNEVYAVGKRHPFPELKAWFQAMYETMFGASQGPRMGSFIALYGIAPTRALIARVLSGEMASKA